MSQTAKKNATRTKLNEVVATCSTNSPSTRTYRPFLTPTPHYWGVFRPKKSKKTKKNAQNFENGAIGKSKES